MRNIEQEYLKDMESELEELPDGTLATVDLTLSVVYKKLGDVWEAQGAEAPCEVDSYWLARKYPVIVEEDGEQQ